MEKSCWNTGMKNGGGDAWMLDAEVEQGMVVGVWRMWEAGG
jgi:hypothetical protein